MSMKVKSIDVSGAAAKGTAAQKAYIAAYALKARADSNRYVPKLSGDLRASSEVQTDAKSGKLVWGGAGVLYARRQFYTQFAHYSTPGTGPRWFDTAKASRGASWDKAGKAAVRQVCK